MGGQKKGSSKSSVGIICDQPGEVWVPISGYQGIYEVSNLGRVKSLPRPVWNYTKPGRIMKQRAKENGYFTVALCNGGTKERHVYVHRLVAAAFIPNPDSLREVNHKNFNKQDNRVENLEWCTSAENKAHFRAGQYAKIADAKKRRTLIDRKIQYIMDNKDAVLMLYDIGVSVADVAEKIKIGRDMVRDILVIYGRL